ncbi:hypothetical protein EES45_16935 [Streptomyces sp. ADI97-07]|uniref:Uncharacterized protein n=1 Tax=Streptomyces clavifer TaxID=68188 RepID=A0ABS4V8K0_9ACTN|nr:hypothetical protein [Streptomyces clavifer]RPK78757.1 hypothetical protein EES45_16935 [Streptomyces sp. ADI97-07]
MTTHDPMPTGPRPGPHGPGTRPTAPAGLDERAAS